MKLQNFIFIGRSGCGKGTQAKLIKDYLLKCDPTGEVDYLQSGAEFREFIKGKTHTQNLSRQIYDAGGLQPEFLAIYIWSRMLIDKFAGNEHLVIDGAPRKFHEAGVLDSAFVFYKREKPYVVFLNVSREWSEKRLLERQRFDDNAKDIKARLDWYDVEVKTAIEFYKNNPRYTLLEINGEQTVEKVHQDILEQIDF